MKILLMNVPREGEVTEFSTPEYLSDSFFRYPPLGLLAIAAEVDPRHEIKILDTEIKNLSLDETIQEIVNFQPDVLGVSIVSRRLYPAYEVCRRAKERLPNVKIIVGGPHINYFPDDGLKTGNVDFSIGGYAEKSFPQFIEALESGSRADLRAVPSLYYREDGKICSNPAAQVPVVIDDLPFPKRELLNLNDYFTACDKTRMTTMYTSRGCPYKCTFCDVQEKTYRYRSTKRIVDEFEYIQSLGINEIHIFDDTFNLGQERVVDMCNEILRRGLKVNWSARVRAHPFDRELLSLMKKSGCTRLQCGVESLNPVSLLNMRKKITLDHIRSFFALCNEFEIETLGYFILGFPEEDAAYRKGFFKEVMSLKPTYIQLTTLYPLPLTQLYNDLLKRGVYQTDHWADFFTNPTRDFNIPTFRDQNLHDELLSLMDRTYRKFYLSPRFIFRELGRKASVQMLVLKAGLALKLMFADSKKLTSGHAQVQTA